MYRDYGITPDGKGEWDFGNASARNVMIFDLDLDDELFIISF